jgi:hypothetical protein
LIDVIALISCRGTVLDYTTIILLKEGLALD